MRVFGVIALVVVCSSVSFFLGRGFAPREEVAVVSQGAVSVRDDLAKVERAVLEGEIKALKAELARAEEGEFPAVPVAQLGEKQEEQPISFNARMEALKVENPELYRLVMDARARERDRVVKARGERDGFLADVDVSLMTEAQRATHEAYCAAVAEMDALEDTIAQVMEDGDSASYQELAQKQWALQSQLSQLRAAEYNALIGALGNSMGLTVEETVALTQLLHQVDYTLGRDKAAVEVRFVEEGTVE